MSVSYQLEHDLSGSSSQAHFVLLLELGERLLLSTGPGKVGSDTLIPAILSIESISADQVQLSVESQALPEWSRSAWWVRRAAQLFQVVSDLNCVEEGQEIFSGIVTAQPSYQDGKLSVELGPSRLRLTTVPTGTVIDSGTWPHAPSESQGKTLPEIYGIVEECPLIPVASTAFSVLRQAAVPGDRQLEIADATGFASSGSVYVDNQQYDYSGKTETTLLGVLVRSRHNQGTAVAQSGPWEFIAAAHPVTSIYQVRSGDTLFYGGEVIPTSASISFSSVPLMQVSGEPWNLTMEFDSVDASSTALSSIHAIRAATGGFTQSAVSISTPLVEGDMGEIWFERPEKDRIISAIYTVTFAVSGYEGKLVISGNVVWSAVAGNVVYNEGGGTTVFDKDDDVDKLDVQVYGDGVVATITGAGRVGYVGNLDDANYALLRTPSENKLSVRQTTSNPNRGPITESFLSVEWFSSGILEEGAYVDVRLNGVSLGRLSQQSLPSQTVSKMLKIDVESQGAAYLTKGSGSYLTNKNIRAVISGEQTISEGYWTVPDPVTSTYYPSYLSSARSSYNRNVFDYVDSMGSTISADSYSALFLYPPAGVDQSALHTVRIYYSSTGSWSTDGTGKTMNAPAWIFDTQDPYTTMNARSRDMSVFSSGVTTSGVILSGGTGIAVFSHSHYFLAPTVTRIEVDWKYANVWHPPVVKSVNGDVYVDNPWLTVSGIALSASVNGVPSTQSEGVDLGFTLPAPPRTINTTFMLPGYLNWSDFTDSLLELEYISNGSSVSIGVVHVNLVVNYRTVTNVVVGVGEHSLTATVNGHSGNPADVLRDLSERSGETTDLSLFWNLRQWFNGSGWVLSRRIDSPTSTATLLAEAASQSLVQLSSSDDGRGFFRKLDLNQDVVEVYESDLLDHAKVSWSSADECANHVTFRYRYVDGSPTRVLVRSASTQDIWAIRGLSQLGEEQRIELDGTWISEDSTAARFVSDWLRLNSPLKRTLELSLPYSFSSQGPGSLLLFYGENEEEILVRVRTMKRDDSGFIQVECDEIPR